MEQYLNIDRKTFKIICSLIEMVEEPSCQKAQGNCGEYTYTVEKINEDNYKISRLKIF